MDLIAAVDKNWAIGNKGSLLISIPEDQKYFRELTVGNVVIYGRKTMANFPNGIPLGERDNIVLSRKPGLTIRNATVCDSLESVLDEVRKIKDKQVYVVGGQSVYEMLLPYCERAYITKIDYTYQADRYFPNLDKLDNWELIADSEEQNYFSVEYYYYLYQNKKPIPF